MAVDVDLRRLDRVAARTFAGLHFRHFNRRVMPGRELTAHNMSVCRAGANLDYLREMIKHRIGDVLRYRFRATADEPDVMVWAALFYERVAFIGFVMPDEVLNRLGDA